MGSIYWHLVLIAIFWTAGAGYSYAKNSANSVSKLEKAFKNAQLALHNTDFQSDYLASFPQNAKSFNRVFAKRSAVYKDALSYIFHLEHTLKLEPRKTMALLLKIGSELKWSEGPADIFQMLLGKSSSDLAQIFVELFSKLSAAQQLNIATFLKAGPRGPAVGFEVLLSQLDLMGQHKAIRILTAD